MSAILNKKFPDFSQKIERLQSLLNEKNQIWAIELSTQTMAKIEKENFTNIIRLDLYNQIIMVWQNHIKNLATNFIENWPFIYNSYHHLFDLFVIIKDHNRITENGIRLVKILIKIQFATKEQIAHLLEDLAILTFKANNFRKAIQLIFLSVFFRQRYQKNKYFDFCFKNLDGIFQNLAPNERAIVLDYLLMNTYNEFFSDLINSKKKDKNASEKQREQEEEENTIYNLKIGYSDFLDELYRSVINSLGRSLRDSIKEVKKINRQVRGKFMDLEQIQGTIFQLQLLREYDWAFLIVKNYSDLLTEENKFKEAYSFILEFIETSYQMGAYNSTFEAYFLLHNLLSSPEVFDKGTKEFNVELVKSWAEATEKFRKLRDKSFFVRSINEFKKLIQNFEKFTKFEEFQNFLFAVDQYYRTVRGHINTDRSIFWLAALHRSVFEEGFLDIAELALLNLNMENHPFKEHLLEKDLKATLKWKKEKREAGKTLDVGGMNPEKIFIKLRIPKKGFIKLYTNLIYAGNFQDKELQVFKEYWEEPILEGLYLHYDNFGKIAYIFFPKELRDYINQLKINSQHIPEVFVIQDTPSYPLEQLNNGTSPLGTIFAFGYRFREPNISQDIKYSENVINSSNEETKVSGKKYNILSIGDMNKDNPRLWNDKENHYYNLYPFPEGIEQSRFVSMKIKELNHLVEDYTALNPQSCDIDTLQKELTKGAYHIIHISANLFYLEDNPGESYFHSSDNKPLSVNTINEMLSYAKKHNEIQNLEYFAPLLIFDGRIINKGKVVKKSFKFLSLIFSNISSSYILGILGRISIEFGESIKKYLGNFLERLLLGDSIGTSLLTANRHLYLMARRILKQDPPQKDEFNRLTQTHYIYFGDPFFKLSF